MRPAFLLAVAVLGACAPQPEINTPAVTERDVIARASEMEGISILDVDRFTPSASIAGCANDAWTTTAPGNEKMAEALKAAQSYSDSQNGTSLIVLRDGNVIHEKYATKVGAQSRTESLSMMKTVTALAVGLAVDEGIFRSVDDPIGNYVVEWRDDPRGAITLRQLLTMHSGLELFPFGVPGGESQKLLYARDINAVALNFPLSSAPGTAFQYNNVNSQLTGMAIDRKVREHDYFGFVDFMQRKLWCPLGNADATLWLDRKGGTPHFFAGLQATARDWVRVGELIRNQGKVGTKQIVPEKWISEMLRPSAANSAYGLHIWRGAAWQKIRKYDPSSPFGMAHTEPYLASDVYFLDGFGGQRVYVIPSRKLTIVRTGEVSMTYNDSIIVNLLLSAQ